MLSDLRFEALKCLALTSPRDKVSAVNELFKSFHDGLVTLDSSLSIDHRNDVIPGRPEIPLLVEPLRVEKRSMHTQEGRAALVHALAHIEFNAINLALDAIWRFVDMPKKYYEDWLKVAKEESYHFQLLENWLLERGFQYGSFSGHNSLWEMVEKTCGDVIARMALVPRTMEARGLDAVPAIRSRFAQIKEKQLVDILDIILHDEIGHVAIGNYWFNYLCKERNIEPIETFRNLAKTYNAPTLKGPFNIEARKNAGFTELELKEILQIN